MERERWQQIEALYHAALERDPAERAAFLDEACATDAALRDEVEDLLACDDETWSFIEDRAVNVLARQLGATNGSAEQDAALTGQQFGAYKILALLGKGGMGEVYRAHDTRLERDVAIKVLPADYAHDADRLRRFEQEARATSALNHPNILTIYDIGEHNGAPYIVAELLEGENLRSQLDKGALATKKAVEFAQQMAAGLAAAHDKGIVHRDLKPENLFVTKDGRVKILDFGLAKLKPRQLGPELDSVMPAQKRQLAPLTKPGVVLGTISYMSPEQVRGQEADPRSDIFAFGIILYEMLSGKQPFPGASMAEVMSAILKEYPPELSETNARVSLLLERIVQHCLEKEPELRFQAARDLVYALEALAATGSAGFFAASNFEMLAARAVTLPAFRQNWRKHFAWLGFALAGLLAVGFASAYFSRRVHPPQVQMLKLALNPPAQASFDSFALSPDGRWLAFTAATGGKLQLWLQALDATEAKLLPGTEGARLPFWSPDSQWLAFFVGGRWLKKLPITGGPPQTVCDVVNPTGGTWGRDNLIIFSMVVGGLRRVSALGSEVLPLTSPDLPGQERNYTFPSFLPDGRYFLYSVLSGAKATQGIYLGSLNGQLKQCLLSEPSSALYAPPGFLLFRRGESLLAQAFDPDQLQLSGAAFTVAEQVGSDPAHPQHLSVSVSNNGIMVLDPYPNRQGKQLLWLDRQGKQLSAISDWWPYSRPVLSPDEKHFVADRRNPKTNAFDLWLSDLSGENATKFTLDPGNARYPLWSPDGSRIAWTSTRADGFHLFQKVASGAGQDELAFNFKGIATDWSRDGRFIFFEYGYPNMPTDIWVQPVAEGQQPYPFIQDEGAQSVARLSPNGRWLAYVSYESGNLEVYVQRFPSGGSKRQVSTNGGAGPHWRRDGKELFYYSSDGKLMAVPVVSDESLELGVPTALFEFRSGSNGPATAPYTVTGDGQRFLVNAIVNLQPNAPLAVIINWAAGVTK